jgi:Tfp pilus assembly protein PilF
VDALVQFAEGEYFYERRAQGDLERAAKAFERAVEIDPEYARAWAGLAGAHGLLAHETDPPSAIHVTRQGEAARRAVDLDPNLGIAHFRLGKYYFDASEPAQAKRHFRESMRLDPGSPLTLNHYAEEALDRGDIRSAIEYLRQAVAADPMGLLTRNNLAIFLLADEQYEAALAEFRSLREIGAAADPGTDTDIVRALVPLGRFAEAEAVIATMPEGRHKDHSRAILVAAPGKREAADAALARLATPSNAGALTDEILDTVWLAEAYAVRNRHDEAIETLLGKKRVLDGRGDINPQYHWYLWHEARLSPMLKPLHSDPRWRKLVREDVYEDG